MAARLAFRPVTKASWADFEALFEAPGGPKYCWCMAWRASPAEIRASEGQSRKPLLEARVVNGTTIGLIGYLDDQQFKTVYKNALALIHPSLMEGFSLTGLEAMALNCPVVSSNSSCLPEIYGNSVLYFDPNNSDELVQKINQLKNNSEIRQKLINLGHQQIKKYSWNKTAKETMAVYKKLL